MSIEVRVAEAVSAAVGTTVEPNQPIREQGLDSLALLLLIVAVETELEREVPERALLAPEASLTSIIVQCIAGDAPGGA